MLVDVANFGTDHKRTSSACDAVLRIAYTGLNADNSAFILQQCMLAYKCVQGSQTQRAIRRMYLEFVLWIMVDNNTNTSTHVSRAVCLCIQGYLYT